MTFWPRVNARWATAMQSLSAKIGVHSSSLFLFRARTQTDIQTNKPTHSHRRHWSHLPTAQLDNKFLSFIPHAATHTLAAFVLPPGEWIWVYETDQDVPASIVAYGLLTTLMEQSVRCVRLSASVCTCSNFWIKRSLSWIFGMVVHLDPIALQL